MSRRNLKKWKLFERLVAAVHLAEKQGAKVAWNEKIEGRQFDVTLRFKLGLYEYLTIIECRDHKKPITASQVEALVTKARDIGAHKAIMVSASGYQKGACRVAKKHGIELFTLEKINEIPDEMLQDELIPALNIYDIKFRRYGSDKYITLSEQGNKLLYLIRNTRIKLGQDSLSLEAMIEKLSKDVDPVMTVAEQERRVLLPKGTMALIPSADREPEVSELSFKLRVVSARQLKESGLDPSLEGIAYRYQNVLTGEKKHVSAKELEPGFDTVLTAGRYYYDPSLEFSYFCERVKNGTARMVLVESYQHGRLIQAEFTMSIEHAERYVEITDAKEIRRLEKLSVGIRKQGKRSSLKT